MKTPVVTTNEYIFYVELVNDNIVFHCDVYKWTKSIRVKLVKDFNSFCSYINNNIYCFMEPTNVKLKKFAHLLGFVKFKDFTGTDGVSYTLFIRRT